MKTVKLTMLVAGLALLSGSAQALDVNIYSTGYSEIGDGPGLGVGTPADSGINFSGATLAGSFTSPGITFGTDTGDNWHPFALGSFGADITGSVNAAGGSYLISLLSDDASYMYIDGILQISRPGPHGPSFTSETISLSPGIHSIEVQFYECCGGPSALDAVLPTGVTFVPTPDGGSTLAMMGGAMGLLGFLARRFRR